MWDFKTLLTLTLLVNVAVTNIYAKQFEIVHAGGHELWIGIQGSKNNPHLNNGGFRSQPGDHTIVNAPDNWEGRMWARTGCNSANNHCETGNCADRLECNGAGGATPVTLVEFRLKGANDLDHYDISLVDGFNVKASVSPIGGNGCRELSCGANINQQCPNELQIKRPGNPNEIIACQSACDHFNTDQYCCRGEFEAQDKCNSNIWPVNYPDFFKRNCPDAYSYANDHSTITCKAEKYVVKFWD